MSSPATRTRSRPISDSPRTVITYSAGCRFDAVKVPSGATLSDNMVFEPSVRRIIRTSGARWGMPSITPLMRAPRALANGKLMPSSSPSPTVTGCASVSDAVPG